MSDQDDLGFNAPAKEPGKSGSNVGKSDDNAGMDRLKLELRRASGPFALFMVLVIGGLITAGDIIRNLAGNKPWQSYKQYQVQFTDAKAITPGRVELRLAGVKVGSIKKAALKNGQAIITLNLEKKYAPMYKDAKVRIRPVTPLEDMYVDITSRGHPQAGKLKKSDILSGNNTTSEVEVGQVLNVLNKGTRTNFSNLLNQLGEGLSDKGVNLKKSFVAIAPFLMEAKKLSVALNQRRENLKRTVHNFGQVTDELALHDKQLAGFVSGADGTLTQLAQDDAPFRSTMAQIPGTLSALQSSFSNLRTTEDTLDPALQSLEPVARKLPKGLDALKRFSEAGTPAFKALQPSARNLRPLARNLRPTAKSASSALKLLGNGEAQQLDNFTRKFVPCLDTTSKVLNEAMSFTKIGDTNPYGTSTGDARAQVRVDFTTVQGGYGKDPAWTVTKPCNDINDNGNG